MECDRGGRREHRGYDESGELQHSNHEVPPDLRIRESHGHDQIQNIDNKRLTERDGLAICGDSYTSCRVGRATPEAYGRSEHPWSCARLIIENHEPRSRLTHRQNSRNPHLPPFHVGLHFCRHHLHHRLAVQQRTSAVDGHTALDRGRPDEPSLLRLGSLPRTLPQRGGPALQDSRRFHHPLSFRRPGAHRARTFQGDSGIQHRDRRTNAALAVFNLLPGFPLDGGRIFRAIVWGVTKNFEMATRVAGASGKLIAYAMILLGAWGAFNGYLQNGLWIAFIGWFILNAAQESVAQVAVRQTLAGLS